jgi:hypothetical protein
MHAGVFDTCLITDGHAYQLPRHLARFKASAQAAGLVFPRSDEAIMRIILDTAAASRKLNGKGPQHQTGRHEGEPPVAQKGTGYSISLGSGICIQPDVLPNHSGVARMLVHASTSSRWCYISTLLDITRQIGVLSTRIWCVYCGS